VVEQEAAQPRLPRALRGRAPALEELAKRPAPGTAPAPDRPQLTVELFGRRQLPAECVLDRRSSRRGESAPARSINVLAGDVIGIPSSSRRSRSAWSVRCTCTSGDRRSNSRPTVISTRRPVTPSNLHNTPALRCEMSASSPPHNVAAMHACRPVPLEPAIRYTRGRSTFQRPAATRRLMAPGRRPEDTACSYEKALC
jgi:hypothetical protein